MNTINKERPGRKGIFYGWWMVLGCAIMNFLTGGTFFYGFTVFFNPIRQTFGWTAAETSVAFTFQRLESGIAGPIVGFLVDRVGPRRLMLGGWAVAGLGLFLMSRLNSLWAFYGYFLVIAIGMSFASFVVTNTAISHWFTKKRSRALTLVYVGFGASGLLVPLLASAVEQFGWRESLVIVAILSWVIGIGLSSLMRHKPSQYGYLPDGESRAETADPAKAVAVPPAGRTKEQTLGFSGGGFTTREALKTRTFWLLSFAFLFQQVGTSALAVHIVPYLESVNISTEIAATAVTGLTLVSLIGRFGFGFLGDFTNKRYLIAIALTLQAVGLLVFSFIKGNQAWLIILFLVIYAPGYGGPIPLRPALQADYFGTRSYGTIMGLMSLISMVGGLVSPVVAGWIFDTTGSYQFAWWLFAIITVPAVPLILLVRPPKTPRPIT